MSDMLPPSTPGPAGAPAPPPPIAKQPKWWSRRFAKLPVWVWGAIAAGIVVIGVASGGADDAADDPPPVAETTVEEVVETTVEESVETTTTEPTPPESDDTTTTQAPEPGFGGGTLLVGVDIEPGLYAAQVPGSGFGCYWARLSDLSGSFDAILANENVPSGAQALVEILPTDEAFESRGCGRWQAPELFDPPQTEFGEGAWIVGGQIAPGRYRSDGPGPGDFGCYWARLSGLDGSFNSLISNGFVEDPTIVEIAAGDAGFQSSGCGTWTSLE